VTGVVHLVGGWKGGTPLPEADPADWTLLHDLLIRTVQHTTRAFAPALREAGGDGRFVIVSSEQAQRPSSENAAYGSGEGGGRGVDALARRRARRDGGTAKSSS
jgi:NADP-dependent 3-hydroxy acid dehydrogenase YdfG